MSKQQPKLPITKPGIYPGINIDVYHSGGICNGPSVSSTGLRRLWNMSPAHFWHEWSCNPKHVPVKPTKPMILGRAAHHIFLGEDDFATLFIMQPDALPDEDGDLLPWQGNRKVCRQWLKDQAKAGRTVLTAEQLETIRGMGQSLAKDPLVQAGALNGTIECSMFTRDKETGLWLKARPDAIPTSDGDFSDIKTIDDISDDGIFRALRYNGLHQQGALIWEVCDALNQPFTSFNLVFVESKPPHCVRVVPLTDDDLNRGRRQNRAMLRLIATCINENRWPGPGFADPRPIGMSQGSRDYIDARLQALGV